MDRATRTLLIHQHPDDYLDTGNWFSLRNQYIDYLLAELGPCDFCVLLVIKRELHGFKKGHKARVSQRELARRTGQSVQTVRRSLERLVQQGHLIREKIGTGHSRTEYRLNEALEYSLPAETTRGANLDTLTPEGTKASAGDTKAAAQPAQIETTTRTLKDSVKDREKDNSLASLSFLSQELIEGWPDIQRELAAQTTPTTYNTLLKPLQPEPAGNGQLILRCRPVDQGWIENRHRRHLLQAIRAVITAPFEDSQLVIVARETVEELVGP
jgi:DNA-binding Lrp family transcriptional regulator